MSLPPGPLLTALSAVVAMVLGFIHAAFTFYGNRLHPTDANVRSTMERSLLVLSPQTTIWKSTLR